MEKMTVGDRSDLLGYNANISHDPKEYRDNDCYACSIDEKWFYIASGFEGTFATSSDAARGWRSATKLVSNLGSEIVQMVFADMYIPSSSNFCHDGINGGREGGTSNAKAGI